MLSLRTLKVYIQMSDKQGLLESLMFVKCSLCLWDVVWILG